MRIISDEKDYYDSVQQTDEDRTPVFVRKETEISVIKDFTFQEQQELWPPQSWPRDYPSVRGGFEPIWVGFCGKVYPFLQLEINPKWCGAAKDRDFTNRWDACPSQQVVNHGWLGNTLPTKSLRVICRSLDDLEQEINLQIQFGAKEKDTEQFRKSRMKDFAKWFTDAETNGQRFLPLFVEHQVPVFKLAWRKHEPQLTLNGNLEQHSFFQVFDAFTAYQEIRMFLTGVLAQPIVQPKPISDEIQRDLAGFDTHSFKRGPTKADKRRKRAKKPTGEE